MNDPKDNKNSAIDNDTTKRPAGAAGNDTNASSTSNPFIFFRRYADDQISSLMNSVMGLPATLSKEHERWHAARQNGSDNSDDTQVTGSGRQEVWVKRWSSEDDDSKGQTGEKKKDDDFSNWVKVWKPDGQEFKPEVVEDKDGGKTWHWSTAWSWPPKKQGNDDATATKPGNEGYDRNELDRNLEEARRNAERELHEVSELFKNWFGADEDNGHSKEDTQQTARGQSLLDWIGLGDGSSSNPQEPRREMENKIKRLEDEFLKARDSFSDFARGNGPWTHLRTSDEAREGSQILQALDGMKVCSWGHPLSYLLDYSSPRTRWLLQHPYSPAVLEAEATRDGVAARAPRYADAFEDLMRGERWFYHTQKDQVDDWTRSFWPRSYRLLFNAYSHSPVAQDFFRNVEEGGEWYVPEKQKQLKQGCAHYATHARDNNDHMYERFLGTHTVNPQTELDMYERFLSDSSTHQTSGAGNTGSSSNQPPATSPPSNNSNNNSNNIDVASSPILSTITTTERNVAADGTVTHKVTLKKRFADGREESSETVNTTRGDTISAQQADESNSSNKKSGWFWSS